MNSKNRREFLKKAGLLSIAAASSASFLSSCTEEEKDVSAENSLSYKTFRWKLITTWPPNFPVLGEAVVSMAKELEDMSRGRLRIEVFGAGELVSAFESFDAVSLGAVQMSHGTPYYWQGKMPASIFFGSVPFGFNAQQMMAWMLYGGGLELWHELYKEVGLIAFPCGNTGVQMGGWFNREINSLEDIKGLKMRIPGLGGKVIAAAGGSAVTISGSEVYTSLERGVVDAAEWIGPYHDYIMGFHRVAKYYYYPGWHEPGSNLELMINLKAYNELPTDLQEMVKTVCLRYQTQILSEFEAKNYSYLKKLIEEEKTEVRAFPEEVLKEFKIHTEKILEEICASDPFSAKVYESMKKFKKEIKKWNAVSELAMNPFN